MLRRIADPRAVRLMQVVIAALVVFGVATSNLSIVINGVLGLVATFLPAILERDYQIALDPVIVLWIATAFLLHTVGMTGPYDTLWWWDHLTHTLSAALVAGVGFAVTRAVDEHWEEIYLPPDFMYVYIIVFTLAAGVLWEVMEFVGREAALLVGQGPFLIQYSLEDSVLDLLFDGLGGVIVAAFARGRFTRFIASLEAAIERATDENGRFRR